MTTVFHAWLYGRIIDSEQSQEKETSQNESRLQLFGRQFQQQSKSSKSPNTIQKRKSIPASYKMIFLQEKTHPFLHQQHQCYQTSQTKSVNFSSTEIEKPLPAPIHSVSQIKFKFRSQFQLLPQIRCLVFVIEVIISVYCVLFVVNNQVPRREYYYQLQNEQFDLVREQNDIQE